MNVRLPLHVAVLILGCVAAVTASVAWRLTDPGPPVGQVPVSTVPAGTPAPAVVPPMPGQDGAAPSTEAAATTPAGSTPEQAATQQQTAAAPTDPTPSTTTAAVAATRGPASRPATNPAAPTGAPSSQSPSSTAAATIRPTIVCWSPHDPTDPACDIWTVLSGPGPGRG